MPFLSGWAIRRPILALVAFVLAFGGVVGLGSTFGGELNDSFSLPATESTQAMDLLDQGGDGAASSGSGARIVWSPSMGSAVDPSVLSVIEPLLIEISNLPSVGCVTKPSGETVGSQCPATPAGFDPAAMGQLSKRQQEEMAAAAAAFAAVSSKISGDESVAYASVTFIDGVVEKADAKKVLTLVKGENSEQLQVGASGQALDYASQEPPSSEGIGILVAIVILLIAFGSVIAAGMPIFVAVVGLAVGQMAVLLVARYLDVATFAPTLAAMIGLGVGIDYALFVMNRFRQAVLAGHAPKEAAREAVQTAGRAVVFAGGTVIIALLGLFVLRIGFFNGLAVAASLTVLMVMLSALWMLPALLSLMGTKALAIRMPWGKKPGQIHPEAKRWVHYGRMLQRRPWLAALGSLAVVIVLAIPLFSLRQGFADDSGKPVGSPSKISYDLMSSGFGPGVNGPFFVAVKLPSARNVDALSTIIEGFTSTEGVASTLPNLAMVPLLASNPNAFGPDGTIATIMVTPNSAPQDEATSALLERLRTEVNPQLERSTGALIYVGGMQAITSDFTTVLTDALPIFLLVVVGLGFLALMLLFRSLVVPLTAAITSLLSFSAAMGITVAVFQWGWLSGPLGLSGTGPIMPFLPIMVFAILFGLSMDYQVFLVSRMQEEWVRTGDNAASVRRGLAGSGRVVMIAAAIMASVFLAFVPTPDATIKLFGISLASAVIIDAFIVRLILVPSLMSILGKANWWLPGWLERVLPRVHVEPGADEISDDVDPSDGGDDDGDDAPDGGMPKEPVYA